MRELENAIERCAVVSRGPRVRLKDLPPGIVKSPLQEAGGAVKVRTLSEAERDAVVEALEAAKGNVSKAARILGITRKRLYRIGREHGLKF